MFWDKHSCTAVFPKEYICNLIFLVGCFVFVFFFRLCSLEIHVSKTLYGQIHVLQSIWRPVVKYVCNVFKTPEQWTNKCEDMVQSALDELLEKAMAISKL